MHVLKNCSLEACNWEVCGSQMEFALFKKLYILWIHGIVKKTYNGVQLNTQQCNVVQRIQHVQEKKKMWFFLIIK